MRVAQVAGLIEASYSHVSYRLEDSGSSHQYLKASTAWPSARAPSI